MSNADPSSYDAIRERAMASGLQLFILVQPDACPVCAMQRGKIFWADEAPTLPHGGCLKDACHCEYRLFDHTGPSLDEMLANGIAAVKAGDKEAAQEWLIQLLQIDRYNEQAWLWLSGAADTDEDRVDCLQEVQKINPDNAFAQRGLETLRAKMADEATGPPEADGG